ncbi:hypothetical protein Mc24_04028 [Thermotoga sp. Mc24]|nr:hypothetical protein Mc24_04028 [Thermotoga sp. Mc24]
MHWELMLDTCFNTSLEVWKPTYQQYKKQRELESFNTSLEVWKLLGFICDKLGTGGFNTSLEVWKPKLTEEQHKLLDVSILP